LAKATPGRGFVNVSLTRMGELFDEGLMVIKGAFRAQRNAFSKGKVIDLGRDHYALLADVGQLKRTLTAGRPRPKPAAFARGPRHHEAACRPAV
jgi:hypothetical protein